LGSVSRSWTGAIRVWPVWKLPGWLLAFVLSVISADAIAIGVAAVLTAIRGHDAELFAILLACDVVTVELTRRSGEPAGLIKEVHAVWELPLALLLPPFYALLAPIVRIALTQWRVRRALAYRRVFTAAALGLSYAAGSVAFHALAPAVTRLANGHQAKVELWALAVVACGVLRSGVNKVLVMTAVKGDDPSVSVRASLFTREHLFGDAAELSVGALVALAVTVSPFMAFLALPCATLLQRSQRHSHLVSESRIDGKTGLLNAVTWQREAAVQVTRAARTREGACVAVLLADIDRFKEVNDTFGHPIGDVVLAECSRTLSGLLRQYDLCGRWGGEEFAILLPDTSAEEAADIARRLCRAVSELTVPAMSHRAGPDAPHVTISIGVAAMSSTHRDLDELVAAADHALYQAKAGGRNTVRMTAS